MRYLISIICIALLLWGCDNSAAVPEKPKVVRKKIVAPKQKTAKVTTKKTVRTAHPTPATEPPPKTDVTKVDKPQPKTAAPKVDMSQPKTTVAKVDKPRADVKNQPPASKPADSRQLIAQKSDPGPAQNSPPSPANQKKPAISPKSEITEIEQTVKSQTKPAGSKSVTAKNTTKPVTTAKAQTGGLPPMYDPTGKIDPFEPLFKEKPVIAKTAKKIKRVPRTPLERVELSQLKLVGIILAVSGNRALVEESSGKGYVIKKGTYIGTNGGKIVKIQKDVVTVEEKFEDVFGKIQTRERELKLPKPPGEF
jgi:type IV pilus assembly protein PilP